MLRSNRFLFTIFLASLLFSFSTFSSAQTTSPAPLVAWEKPFPRSIDWYFRLSSGLFIVRSGKSLIALDLKDGQQLWTIQEIEIGGEGGLFDLRGANIVEAPGLPILIINRAKLPGAEKGELLGVNLWTGAIQWRQPELDDIISLLPLYDSKRVLLCTKKIDKRMKTAIVLSQVASPFVPGAGLLSLYYSGPYPFKPVFTMLDPMHGTIDWTREYPRILSPGFLTFRQFGSQAYLHEVGQQGGTLLAAISLQSGERVWEFKGGSPFNASTPLPLQFAAGKIILSVKNLTAFDASSNNPSWHVANLGKLFGLVVDGNVIYGTSRHEAFALDASKGTFLWKTPIKPDPTNPLLLPEANELILCDKKEFLALDAATGKILRRAKTNLQENPLTLRREGKLYILATHASFSTLFELSGQRFSDEPLIGGEFPAVSFLTSHPLPLNGTPGVPEESFRQLRSNWQWLKESADSDRGLESLERMRPWIEDQTSRLDTYIAAGDVVGHWRLWRINPATGIKEEFPVKNSKLEADPLSEMFYEVQKTTLRALRAASNPQSSTDAKPQPAVN